MSAARFLPAALWAAVIYWMSSGPAPQLEPLAIPGVDKLLHALTYAVLTAFLLFGARWPTGVGAWAWVAVACVYALTDEVHQAYVPGRRADAWDLLADGAGAFVAAATVRRRCLQRSDQTR